MGKSPENRLNPTLQYSNWFARLANKGDSL